MINAVIGGAEELLITSADGREFRLRTSDFPQSALPYDRVNVEEQIEAMIQGVFDENIRVHIFSLDPLRYTMSRLPEGVGHDWWVH